MFILKYESNTQKTIRSAHSAKLHCDPTVASRLKVRQRALVVSPGEGVNEFFFK